MLVAGVDEVGQGAMAGPLVVCAALFDIEMGSYDACDCGLCVIPQPTIVTPCPIPGVKDSKKFSSRQKREGVAALIESSPALLAKGFGVVPSSDINRKGMAWAWKAATQRALSRLATVPELVLTDGSNRIPNWEGEQVAIPKADATLWPVSAASVLAKVCRDRWMIRIGESYPGYAWDQNVGYGTQGHSDGLIAKGITPVHRLKWITTWFANKS